jgi:hypothetical protein
VIIIKGMMVFQKKKIYSRKIKGMMGGNFLRCELRDFI